MAATSLKAVLVPKMNQALDSPEVIDPVRIEELHRPSGLGRRKTSEKQYPAVLRQERFQRMPFYDDSASGQIHTMGFLKCHPLGKKTAILHCRTATAEIIGQGPVSSHNPVARNDRRIWIDVQRISNGTRASRTADNLGNLPISSNASFRDALHRFIDSFRKQCRFQSW